MRSTWPKSSEKRLFGVKLEGKKLGKRAELTGMRKSEEKGAFS